MTSGERRKLTCLALPGSSSLPGQRSRENARHNSRSSNHDDDRGEDEIRSSRAFASYELLSVLLCPLKKDLPCSSIPDSSWRPWTYFMSRAVALDLHRQIESRAVLALERIREQTGQS